MSEDKRKAAAKKPTKKAAAKKPTKKAAAKKPTKKVTKPEQLTEEQKEVQQKLDFLFDDDVVKHTFEKGCFYQFKGCCWGAETARLKDSDMQANKEIISGRKQLIDKKSMDAISRWKYKGKSLMNTFGYNFEDIKGIRFVPKQYHKILDEQLAELKEKFHMEADKWVYEEFPTLQKEWEEKDPAIFDVNAYPQYPEGLRSKFSFEYRKFIISIPSKSLLSDKEYTSELNKQKKQMQEFLTYCLNELASEFITYVKKLKENMAEGKGIGKKRIESMQEFIGNFDSMNITKNSKLKELVEKFDKTVSNKNQEDFKAENVQKEIKKGMAEIETAFEKDAVFKRAIEF